jgi:hypothetical protein
MSGAIPLLPLYAFHGVDKENINLLRLWVYTMVLYFNVLRQRFIV